MLFNTASRLPFLAMFGLVITRDYSSYPDTSVSKTSVFETIADEDDSPRIYG